MTTGAGARLFLLVTQPTVWENEVLGRQTCRRFWYRVMPAESFLSQVRDASGEPDVVLRLTLDHFQADTGTFHELGPDGLLHLKAWAGSIPDELLPVIETIPVGKGIAGMAVERNAPVDLCNLQTDQSGAARPGAKQTGVQGSICVPLTSRGRAVGALGIGTHREREFSEEEIALLMEVGREVGGVPASAEKS